MLFVRRNTRADHGRSTCARLLPTLPRWPLDHESRSTGWSKILCAPDDYLPTQLMSLKWPSQNTFGMWTVLYRTRSSRTQFGVSMNVWGLAGDVLNITCNFLYCNHQVHRDFLVTLYFHVKIFSKTLFCCTGIKIIIIFWDKSLLFLLEPLNICLNLFVSLYVA